MEVATDAPVSSRQIGRIGRRAFLGLGRAGGIADHNSGDFIIMFTNDLEGSQLTDASPTLLMCDAVEATNDPPSRYGIISLSLSLSLNRTYTRGWPSLIKLSFFYLYVFYLFLQLPGFGQL